MNYVFSKKGFKALENAVQKLEIKVQEASDAKIKSGSEQDGWHDEGFRTFMVEEEMWAQRLSELRAFLSGGRIVTPIEQNFEVKFGVGVEIEYMDNGESFSFIMDGYLITPQEGRVSVYSPIADALLKARVGEERTIKANNKERKVIVKKIVAPSKAEDWLSSKI